MKNKTAKKGRRNALQRRVLKTNLYDFYEKKGYKIDATDTPAIVLFSDKSLKRDSQKIGDYICSWITSFGEKEAEKILGGE